MKKEPFANRLKLAMNTRNLKQIDIVNRTKIDKTLLNKYLKGISEPKQDKLTMLADALNVNEIWLMGYDAPMEREKDISNLERIISTIRLEEFDNWCKNIEFQDIINCFDEMDILSILYFNNEFYEKIVNNYKKIFKLFKVNNLEAEKIFNKNFLNEVKHYKLVYYLKKNFSENDFLKELSTRVQFDDKICLEDKIKILQKYKKETFKDAPINPNGERINETNPNEKNKELSNREMLEELKSILNEELLSKKPLALEVKEKEENKPSNE